MAGIFDYDRREQSLYRESSMYGQGLGFQVYVNSEEPARINADAVTKGSSIFLSERREDLLRHELGHVIQQKRGIVPVTGYVEGQPLNDNALLEQEAEQLGSRIPQQTVDRAWDDSRQGMPLKGVRGVVQCCGRRKPKAQLQAQREAIIQQKATALKELGDEITRIKSDMSMKSKMKQQKLGDKPERFESQEKDLINELNNLYGPGHESLIRSLVTNIGNGSYTAIGPELRGHLFRGLPLPVTPPPKKKTGKGNGDIPVPQMTTGLHAYTDSENGSTGQYPPGIVPIGIIGNQNEVHILHWRAEHSSESKFSTMLPASLHEGISKLLFEVALGAPAESTFADITMNKSGATVYPDGSGVVMRNVTRGMALGETGKGAAKLVTLGEIFQAYNPETGKEGALRRALRKLIQNQIYLPQEGFGSF